MAREIKSPPILGPGAAAAPTPNSSSFDDFKDRLVKLIPSEIVTAYVTIQGLIAGVEVNTAADTGNKEILLWIVVILLFIMTPIYLYFVMDVKKWPQIIFTSIAFLIWVMVIGGPLKDINGLSTQFIGSILLIFYTLFIPIIYKG